MSWIGKAYHITEITKGRYYYPREPDGRGETSPTSRLLKDGEVAEWILLDGTPATCANIALHNIYPKQIDLLVGTVVLHHFWTEPWTKHIWLALKYIQI
ncbi:hypothetical protein SERLA73DRAFT_132245 [Serpula lacrymans var. lacrymans S7.3]|uniref:Uncharacterized protein n=2 Tax=Serpula lacrymans var. lacrymans TaxID=341189 RepID=F8PNM1_SERL3|nr:uncharacterized protein SERLADRAFT_382120 [Serpula lacrymans var. lacrymans S7.9]EGO01748.1 hypothetical protein SERLA73DRAFT_132245 [Serpula lacrymans var. lacrymans S7.3]EGO27385.1 hypothetical protein SERLADRAFT_382120 [Serpula lacrymans var. lacrymans S7.9]